MAGAEKDLGCFEIRYRSDQKPALPPPFQVFDATAVNQPAYRELSAFERFVGDRIWDQYAHTGLFSPRFLEKTGLDVQTFLRFMDDHPEQDVYLFHPFPRELSLANHFLELAELEHPGITAALDHVWCRLQGQVRPDLRLPQEALLCCHCHYMVGSRRFWSAYGSFISGFMDLLRREAAGPLHASTPYTLSRTEDTHLPMAVFAFERSLSLFLAQHKGRWRVANFSQTPIAGWVPPELFTGEAELVNQLQARMQGVNGEQAESARQLAVRTYYEHRRRVCAPA